jgi:hypothetical protein
MRLLKVLQDMAAQAKGPALMAYDGLVGTWSDQDVRAVLGYMREWNANSKHAAVAQVSTAHHLSSGSVERLIDVVPVCIPRRRFCRVCLGMCRMIGSRDASSKSRPWRVVYLPTQNGTWQGPTACCRCIILFKALPLGTRHALTSLFLTTGLIPRRLHPIVPAHAAASRRGGQQPDGRTPAGEAYAAAERWFRASSAASSRLLRGRARL